MLYRSLGKTGKDLSVISFGGMRFAQPDNLDRCVEMIHYAHSRGINNFDTAPFYCADRSEDIFGAALKNLPRDSYCISSKCGRPDGDEFRRALEKSLTRLGLDQIDVYYVWHLMNEDDWEARLKGGAVDAAVRASEEGLIGHLFCSSHMEGESLARVLEKDIFEGVLLGYNVLNAPYREAAINLAGQHHLGVLTMNPLGGGLIPQNPERFGFLSELRRSSLVQAALHFNLSHPAVTSAVVGMATRRDIDEAVAAIENYRPFLQSERAAVHDNTCKAFAGLCTGCGYCLPCPAKVAIPKHMDSYNQLILSDGDSNAVKERYRLHWRIPVANAGQCIACGACEERCTQHLPIIKRLAELAA